MKEEIIHKNILENMSDGVMTIDLEGRIIIFNKAAEQILDLRKEEVLGKSFGEVFLMKEGNDDFNQTVLNAVYESQIVHNNVVAYHTGREDLTLAVATSFLQEQEEEEEKKIAVIVVFHDMTEINRLQQAEQKLADEIKAQHKELGDAYLSLERSNKDLHAALKKVQVVRILATFFIILLFAGVGFYTWKMGPSLPAVERRMASLSPFSKKTTGAPSLSTYTVAAQPLAESITLKGNLKPIRVVNITSPFNGNIKEKFFQYGQVVEKGQRLLVMDTDEVEMKQRDAKAAYIKAQERVRELQNWDNNPEVSRAKRSLSKAKLGLENQKKTLDETEVLYRKGIVPGTEFQNAKQQYVSMKMDYEAADEELKNVLAKGGGENLNIAKLELENARNKLADLERQLKTAEVWAPVSGTIILPDLADKEKKGKVVERGVSFSQGEILISVGDIEGLSVTADVDEIEVMKIKKGQEVRTTGDAFPGITLRGRISHVSVQASKGTGEKRNPSFEVTVSIAHLQPVEREKIRLGMSANFEVLVYNRPDALTVPIRAVRMEGKDRVLTLKDKKTGEVKTVKVETGYTTLEGVEIIKGVREGDQVVLSP